MEVIVVGVIFLVFLIAFLVFLFTKSPDPINPEPPIEPTGPMCTFMGQALYENRIIDSSGVPVGDTEVPCSSCDEYRYEDEDGCIPLSDSGTDVCTLGFRNVTGNWGVPTPRAC